MLMDVLRERSVPVFGIGKIHDIYNGRGVEDYVTTKNNSDGMEKLTAAVRERKKWAYLLQSRGFRHVVRTSQRRGRICEVARRV